MSTPRLVPPVMGLFCFMAWCNCHRTSVLMAVGKPVVGYHYSDNRIYGFSHIRLSGAWVSDYGDILIIPTRVDFYILNDGINFNLIENVSHQVSQKIMKDKTFCAKSQFYKNCCP